MGSRLQQMLWLISNTRHGGGWVIYQRSALAEQKACWVVLDFAVGASRCLRLNGVTWKVFRVCNQLEGTPKQAPMAPECQSSVEGAD